MTTLCLQPTVFWLTGLSGTGKTTVGQLLVEQLKKINEPTIHLDGDVLRAILGRTKEYARDDRFNISMQYSKLAQLITSQGYHAVCSTISLFHETQNWNRKNHRHYIEVFFNVPIEEVAKRDNKKIYSSASEISSPAVVGLDIKPEFPKQPDIELLNYNQQSAESSAAKIFAFYNNKRRS